MDGVGEGEGIAVGLGKGDGVGDGDAAAEGEGDDAGAVELTTGAGAPAADWLVLAFDTASAVQEKVMSAGAALLSLMVKPDVLKS